MKNLFKSAMLAGLLLAAGSQTALAQATAAAPVGPVVPGLAVANLDAVVANSNAYRTAQQQRPVTYKAQLDQAEARRKAIAGQLQPLIDKFTRDRAAPNANQAALQQQAQSIQQIQSAGEQELQRLVQPVALSEAYVEEQITDKIDAAVKAAMAKNKISLLLAPQAVAALNNNAYNLNQAILTELNTLIPAAQLVPPAGWEPREQREQRAAQAAQQGQAAGAAATPARPAGQQPDGR
ncbi:MAG: OmpH family outer membrane protein [Novosphingobium sp.]|nr:OmpH family outer membrane protein [Novosphingobium sp.]